MQVEKPTLQAGRPSRTGSLPATTGSKRDFLGLALQARPTPTKLRKPPLAGHEADVQ